MLHKHVLGGDGSQGQDVKKSLKSGLRLLVGLLLLAGIVHVADPLSLLQRLRHADKWWLCAGLLAGIGSNLVSAWRWRELAQWFGARMSVPHALQWYFQAIGLNVLLPGAVVGGDVYRAVMLQRNAAANQSAGISVFLDRISGLWMLCAIGAAGAALNASVLAPVLHLPAEYFAAAGVAIAVIWLAMPIVLLHWLKKSSALSRLPPWAKPLQAAVAQEHRAKLLWVQALLSALVQLLSATALACGGVALGLNLPWSVWAFAIAPIFLMAALPVSVGGWGTREAACVAALAPFGVAAASAIGVGLLYGFFALVQGALGALVLGLPRRNQE